MRVGKRAQASIEIDFLKLNAEFDAKLPKVIVQRGRIIAVRGLEVIRHVRLYRGHARLNVDYNAKRCAAIVYDRRAVIFGQVDEVVISGQVQADFFNDFEFNFGARQNVPHVVESVFHKNPLAKCLDGPLETAFVAVHAKSGLDVIVAKTRIGRGFFCPRDSILCNQVKRKGFRRTKYLPVDSDFGICKRAVHKGGCAGVEIYVVVINITDT